MISDSSGTEHPALGPFTPTPHGSWTASYRLKTGKAMDVTVSKDLNLASNIDGIAQLLLVLEECEPAIRQTIAEALLDTHNDGWNETGSPITSAQFVERIGDLTGVTVWNPEALEAFFDDGDLFWGHTFIVDVAKDGAASNARFEG